MTHRERFIKALKREKTEGLVPHFELVFFLTMEVLGKVHPIHRTYHQWNQMSVKEKELQLADMASCYTLIAKKYNHSAIFIHPNPSDFDNTVRLLEIIREQTGNEYFLMMHGDPTFEIPRGENIEEFAALFYEEPEKMKGEAQRRVDNATCFAEKIAKKQGLLDGFALCSDYCFNVNPFFSPSMFSEFVTPYLNEIVNAYRKMGFYSIKHTDGNILPIVDQIAECKPDALHSLDPQGGVSLSKIKRLYGDKLCLIGNVNCGLLQTGTDEECRVDILRSLKEGMVDGKGYIFSTSNCVYTGLPLERYETMNKIWLENGRYYPLNETMKFR